ncbi:nitrilase-related carbon-nitrogen hydrolase [Streptomyces triticiradicis]|uniref:Carbon-nitrogen family hydrolase n=1 Tax=Streptomyces triticiradicis TaxID=2651189 RepID=A0A7J5DJL2_9ACTN|nr:nitrilase-related carbon-nitrogen hydrolase [Streptomyces triticiradicis]KAB1988889.1 carbon-nitrogen family hydrolase [Streptomyces triticiradicis]
MRASLIQLSVDSSDSADERRRRAASLVRGRAGDDLVVLPELWTAGAWAYDRWEHDAEKVDGPTAAAMSAAAREAGVWLHAGSVVERGEDGTLYNTALLFDRAGELRGRYRKIHRYGFDTGEATLMVGGDDIVTVPTDFGVVGLAICYDLRFPELFRGLLDAGAELVAVPAAWPAARLTHWRLLTRTRALEEQVFLLACCATGTHGDMRQAGHSVAVDPWGTALGEAGTAEETLTVECDMAQVARMRSELPVLRDRVLAIEAPRRR